MTAIPFKEEFAKPVEDGTKGQTIRQAKCVTDCDREGMDFYEIYQPSCYVKCNLYEHRIKKGDTLQLYTGMMQRLYCKRKGFCDWALDAEEIDVKTLKCTWSNECMWKGAKLLKTTTCTESFPIKFEDLIEEIAVQDGFKRARIAIHPGEIISETDGQRHFISADRLARLYGIKIRPLDVTVWDFRRPENNIGLNPDDFLHLYPLRSGKYHKIKWTALSQLKDFLTKQYKAKDGDVFQVIRW